MTSASDAYYREKELKALVANMREANARLVESETQKRMQIEGLREMLADALRMRDEAETSLDRHRTALTHLRNEVAGLMGITHLDELIPHWGVTNVRCLERRLKEADEVIYGPAR